jgi:hypothetical protein
MNPNTLLYILAWACVILGPLHLLGGMFARKIWWDALRGIRSQIPIKLPFELSEDAQINLSLVLIAISSVLAALYILLY